jgi:type II secretory pathway component PulC
MKPTIPLLATLGLALCAAAGSADAQQPASQPQAGQTQTPEVTLVYEREVFVYRAASRRDPFRPLTDEDELGPRFESLSLRGIIYSTGASRSIALLADGGGRVHRVREGDVLGNARVVEIGPTRVVMAVETFGTIRQEMLELQRRGGAQR